ncbi:hypothetical protein P3T29_001069, partial [Kitasatospora sp. MAP5-34]|nr:hypothetical protein [Kitasatospora sp. MAP5-34]
QARHHQRAHPGDDTTEDYESPQRVMCEGQG